MEECVEGGELAAGFGHGVGDGGEAGEFGVDELVDHRDGGAFVDFLGGRLEGTQRLACELTVRDGKVVYDLNGMIADPWDTLPPTARGGDPKWDRTRGH